MVYLIKRFLAIEESTICYSSRWKYVSTETITAKDFEILGSFDSVREASKVASRIKGAELCRELPEKIYKRDFDFEYLSVSKKRIKKMC